MKLNREDVRRVCKALGMVSRLHEGEYRVAFPHDEAGACYIGPTHDNPSEDAAEAISTARDMYKRKTGNEPPHTDTWVQPEEYAYPHGNMTRKGAAMCDDEGGKLRRVMVGIPDTYFSAPAYTRIKGKRVKGFVYFDGEVMHFRTDKNPADK